MNFLKGKLTYLVAFVTAVWAVTGFFLHTLDGATAATMVLAALGTFGIRRAMQ